MTGADLLFDPIRLAADDRHALLPAAATAGAQVRATAEQVAAFGALPRPRALVVVGARAETTGSLVAACATSAAAPILGVPRLPGWIGPLDVVVVLAAASDDPTNPVAGPSSTSSPPAATSVLDTRPPEKTNSTPPAVMSEFSAMPGAIPRPPPRPT